MKKQSLADAIACTVATVNRRQTWWDHLPKEARDELSAVRERWRAGEYGRAKALTVAKLLKPLCDAKGWRMCDARRLSEWLRESDD